MPPELPWECWTHFPPTGPPGLHGSFPAPRGAEQEEAAGWEGSLPNFYLVFFLKQQLPESCDHC